MNFKKQKNIMKYFFTLTALILTLSGYCQKKEYTYENKGVNIFLESEGSGSQEFGIGGIALTAGYQFNPNIFLGIGFSQQFGGDRDIDENDQHYFKGWKDNNGNFHYDYYIDSDGFYHETGYNSDNYCYDDDCDSEFFDLFSDVFINVRYNFLGKYRYTPYIDLRTGVSFGDFSSVSSFDEALIGCRFGCGEGDFAIVAGAGYSYRRFTNDFSNQNLFTLRLGVEF